MRPTVSIPDRGAAERCLHYELAHTLQQAGALHPHSAKAISRDGDPAEQAAYSAAEAVLAGTPMPELSATAPVVARRPAVGAPPDPTSAAAGFWIYITLNEPVDGDEFCIRAVMQGHEVDRNEAELPDQIA